MQKHLSEILFKNFINWKFETIKILYITYIVQLAVKTVIKDFCILSTNNTKKKIFNYSELNYISTDVFFDNIVLKICELL